MSKLGLHANRTSPHLVSFVRDARPRIVKFLDHDLGTVQACRAASPNTLLIGRLFTGDQRYQNPQPDAQAWVDKILPVADRMRGLYEAWESYNELEPPTPDEAKRFNEFHVYFAQKMHAHGLKTIAYNFSTGVPKLDFWQYYQDGAEASDYIGLHEYDAPTMDRVHKESLAKGEGGMFLCLRYRRVWNLLRPAARKPIIITECGIDGGVINETYRDDDGNLIHKAGYKDFEPEHTTADYMNQLTWYDNELLKDDYVVGACIFCFGADIARWNSFDVESDDDMRERLRQVITRPVGATPPVPTPKPPSPAPLPDKPLDKPKPCAIPTASWFAARYDSDANVSATLGCPIAPDSSTLMAEQPYQNGLMIYRADTRQIYALLNNGSWSVFADTWSSDQPEGGFVTPPPGLFEPKRGFGKVWREKLGGSSAAIGFATATEQGVGGQTQNFEHGSVIRNEHGVVRVLLANSRWQ